MESNRKRRAERTARMVKEVFYKTMRVGRVTVFMVGLAVMLALVLGIASAALGANGKPLILGKGNLATKVSTLVNRGVGPALSLKVKAGQPPLAVNSPATVVNLSADKIDGKDSSDFAGAYKRTVVVSPVGAPAQNGTALKNALAGITGASESEPYLLKIEPGVYDLGAAPGLVMKPWVDIEGSGEGVTTLTATGGGTWTSATVRGASNTELRSLTVKNTGGANMAFAIHSDAASFRLTRVSAIATGGLDYSRAVVIDAGTVSMRQVSATAAGNTRNIGVFVAGTAKMDGVTAIASGDSATTGIAVQGEGSRAEIHNSRIAGRTETINNFGTVRVAATQLDGGPARSGGSGNLKCVASYNGNYDPLNASCT